MDEHGPESHVTGYEDLISSLTLPDLNDRHVLAAAIHCGAALIITLNLSDFPATILELFDMQAIHPDEFIVRLWDEHPAAVLEAARLQRAGLKKPPKTAAEFIATLEKCQLPKIAARLRPYAAQI